VRLIDEDKTNIDQLEDEIQNQKKNEISNIKA
jgi:hypothetical protein